MREIWRVAYALLHDAFEGAPPVDAFPLFADVPDHSLQVVSKMIERGLNAPYARGVGRYFDAFGALFLDRPVSTFEGQIAIAWDQAARGAVRSPYPFTLDRSVTPMEVDLRPTLRAAMADSSSGASPGEVSASFHNTLASLTVEVVEGLLKQFGDVPVALTGGVFQNAGLVANIVGKFPNEIRVLRHGQVPPGDGGIALGQALIADAILGDKG